MEKKDRKLRYLSIPAAAAAGAIAYKKHKARKYLQQTRKAKLKRVLNKAGEISKATLKITPKAALLGALVTAPALGAVGLGYGSMLAGAKGAALIPGMLSGATGGVVGGAAGGAIRGMIESKNEINRVLNPSVKKRLLNILRRVK